MTSAQLLLLLDSRSPAGGHSHSGGLEAAVDAGLVRGLGDLRAFCTGRLATGGVVAAGFSAAACGLWRVGGDPDGGWRSTMPCPHERRRKPNASPLARWATACAGCCRGVAFRPPTCAMAWAQLPAPAPHHPLVLGAGCALAGGTPELAARAAALGICTTAGSSAVRLLGLDPYAVHAMVSDLGPEIDRIALQAKWFASPDRVDSLPALAAPAVELLADDHARKEVRLFAS